MIVVKPEGKNMKVKYSVSLSEKHKAEFYLIALVGVVFDPLLAREFSRM